MVATANGKLEEGGSGHSLCLVFFCRVDILGPATLEVQHALRDVVEAFRVHLQQNREAGSAINVKV